jgi:hypothetical protein
MRVVVKVKISLRTSPSGILWGPGLAYRKLNEKVFRAWSTALPATFPGRGLLMYESLWTLPLAMILIFGLGFGIFHAVQPREP